jgi:hypothetical protein
MVQPMKMEQRKAKALKYFIHFYFKVLGSFYFVKNPVKNKPVIFSSGVLGILNDKSSR